MAAVAGNQAALLCVMGEAGRGRILWGLRVEGNCWRLKRRGLRFGKMNVGQNCPEGARQIRETALSQLEMVVSAGMERSRYL